LRVDINPPKRPEVRERISAGLEGRKLSEESRRKMSASRMGKATGDSNGMRRPEVADKFRKPKSELTKSRMTDAWINRKRLKQPDFFDIWESQHLLAQEAA
jgi:hypothetical protein